MAQLRKLHNPDLQPSAAIVHDAAQWLAHLESGDASDQDHADFDAWLSANAAHALAFDRLGGLRNKLDSKANVERETLRRLLLRPKRQVGALCLLSLAIFGSGWMTLRHPSVQLYFADEKTVAGETRLLQLSDGSRLTLSTESAVNITADGRKITLLGGEILAQVAKKDGKPFSVVTNDGTTTALGTSFTVRSTPASTIISVAESRVQACPSREEEKQCLTLTAGQTVRMTRHKIDRLPDLSPNDVGAWAEGWLTVTDRPLVEVLDELNRWRTRPIAFDRLALAELRVSGIFPLRNPDKAAANLTKLLPIVIDYSDPKGPIMHLR